MREPPGDRERLEEPRRGSREEDLLVGRASALAGARPEAALSWDLPRAPPWDRP